MVNELLIVKHNAMTESIGKSDQKWLAKFAPFRTSRTRHSPLDEMVYALYGLTPEEIAIVEGEIRTNKHLD